MEVILTDGGRAAAGFKGAAGDCVTRSIAIASGKPYAEIYASLAAATGSERPAKGSKAKGATARNGIHTSRKWFKDYMRSLGFSWTPTMGIGTGCKVHLHDGELPMGRLVVAVSKHYTAVIDGVIHDAFDPQRSTHWTHSDGSKTVSRRCVYGYWSRVAV